MVFTIDLDGRFLLVEGGGLDVIGLLPSAKGQLARNYYRGHPEALAVIDRALAGEAFMTMLHFGTAHLDVHVAPLIDDSGTRIGALAIAVDATQRHVAEVHRATERKAIDLVTAAGNLRRSVPAVLKLLVDTGGWDAAVFWPASPDGQLEDAQTCGFGESMTLLELQPLRVLAARIGDDSQWLEHLDSEVDGWKSALFFPVRTADLTLAVIQLFSRRMRAEDLRQQQMVTSLGRQLGEYAARRRAQEALRDSEELRRIRDDVSAMVAHDLKNPLAVIVSNLNYIGAELTSGEEELQQAIADACSAAERAFNLVKGLVAQIRLESGHFNVDRRPASLQSLLADVLRPRQSASRERRIAFDCCVPRGLSAKLDIELVTRAVDNLVDNAMRYVPDGGTVVVDARLQLNRLRITVGNSGPPIMAEDRAHIFEKYAQSSAKNSRMNVGLGLYFCRLVATAHGGTIHVEETPSLPVVFVLDLPTD